MLRPLILQPSAAWLSRAPLHSGHGRGRRYGATAFCVRSDSSLDVAPDVVALELRDDAHDR